MDLFDERLHKALDYDPETGVMTWLKGPYNRHRAGHVEPDGGRRVCFEGERYDLPTLIFRWVRGCWPSEVIWYRNGDRSDTRWQNLTKPDQLVS
jgi:hypothetical protein